MARAVKRDTRTGRFVRSLTGGKETLTNPMNPSLFGESVEDLAITGLGMSASALVNDKVVSPIIRNFMPTSGGQAMGKLTDAATTIGSGYLAGEIVGIAHRRIGKLILRGGMLLGIAKAVSVVIPNFSLSAQYPSLNWFPTFGSPAAIAPVTNLALPAGSTANVQALGVGTSGL